MNRRRKANIAEAVVKGIGSIVLMFLLLGVCTGPLLTGENPVAMLASMIQALFFLAGLVMLVCVAGLVVWRVVKGAFNQPPACRVDKPEPPPWVPDLHGTPPRRHPSQGRR